MVKILSCTYFPHQAKDFICSVTKPLENTTEHLTNSAMEISRQASEAVTSTQKALLSINERPRLNLDSEAVEFFGLKSYEDMAFKNGEELLTKFKMEELACKSLIPENASDGLRKGSKLFRLFDELSPDCGCARMTFYDRCFGGAMHTIGFVRNKDNMYVLDSLGHNTEIPLDVKILHQQVNSLLSLYSNGKMKIIWNCNPQQSMNEITCNHWTFANIDALTKALKSGKIIEDKTTLDSVLPHDINKVLDEQLYYVLNKGERI